MLIQRVTKGCSNTKDAVTNCLGHRTREGFGNLWRGCNYWKMTGSVCRASIHLEWNQTRARTTIVLWKPSVMSPFPESGWTNDHFNRSNLQIFFLVSMILFCQFSSQCSSPSGNHRFLLQCQLFPLATFILLLHSPCLQVKHIYTSCHIPMWPSITLLSYVKGE